LSNSLEKFIKFIKYPVILGAIPAIIIGGDALHAALEHNPQGEFRNLEDGHIHFWYCFLLFISWFLPTFVPITFIVSLCKVGIEWYRQNYGMIK